jgi:large subunit ribosomal protein L25
MADFNLNAESRKDEGKGASRRLRRAGKVPAILYGHGDPVSLTLDANELANHIKHEAFFSHILNLKIDGKEEQAIMKDMQRHPFKPVVLHVDLLRVKKGQKLHVNVPLHFLNDDTAYGVKQEGGVMSHNMTQLEVYVLPKDLPEYIEVDVAELKIGESLHLSEIKLPEGVESIALSHGDDPVVVSINHPRVEKEETEGEEVEEKAEVPTVADEKKEDEGKGEE